MEIIDRKVYSIPEVAEMLGISKSYAYELVKRKQIPVLELGTRKVVPKVRFDNWIDNNSGESQ